jgi:hypothetical protein
MTVLSARNEVASTPHCRPGPPLRANRVEWVELIPCGPGSWHVIHRTVTVASGRHPGRGAVRLRRAGCRRCAAPPPCLPKDARPADCRTQRCVGAARRRLSRLAWTSVTWPPRRLGARWVPGATLGPASRGKSGTSWRCERLIVARSVTALEHDSSHLDTVLHASRGSHTARIQATTAQIFDSRTPWQLWSKLQGSGSALQPPRGLQHASRRHDRRDSRTGCGRTGVAPSVAPHPGGTLALGVAVPKSPPVPQKPPCALPREDSAQLPAPRQA